MSPTPSLDKKKVEAKGCCPCPKKEVKAKTGDTVTLPCSVDLSSWNFNKSLLSWEKRHGPENIVTVHTQKGIDEEVCQGRTSLPFWKDEKGDLELRDAEPSDSGVYTFWITQVSDEEESRSMCCEVTLTVEPGEKTVVPEENECCQGCCGGQK